MDTNIKEFLENIKGKVAIITHAYPDPDAISSAIGIQWILFKLHKIKADVFFGDISHIQNRTMVNTLNITSKNIPDFKALDYTTIIGVDVDVLQIRKQYGDIEPAMIIDHHDQSACSFVPVCSLIEQVGACATLIHEIIKGLELEFKSEADQVVATALCFGIMRDTQNLLTEGTTAKDTSAWVDMLPFADKPALSKMGNYPLPSYYFDLLQKMGEEGNHVIKDTIFVGGVPPMATIKRDSIPMLANHWARREGLQTAVVFSIVDGVLEASVRSTSTSVDLKKFCAAIFSKEHSGAKVGEGGAKLPLPMYDPEAPIEVRDHFWESLKVMIFHKVLTYATGE